MTCFVALPVDILLIIFVQLNVDDFIFLSQTCRVMHLLASNDYLWHRLIRNFDLPLDIPFGVDSRSLSGDDLRKLVIAAKRLDRKWHQPIPKIRYAPLLPAGPIDKFVDGMQLLPGAKWLVTTQVKSNRRTQVSLWSLENLSNTSVVTSFDIPARIVSFHAELQDASKTVFIALVTAPDLQNPGNLQVRSISLGTNVVRFAQSRLIYESSDTPEIVRSRGVMNKVSLHKNLVATTLISFPNGIPQCRIFCHNLSTNVSKIVQPFRPQGVCQYYIRLCAEQIIFAYTRSSFLHVVLHALPLLTPDAASSERDVEAEGAQNECAPILADYYTTTIPMSANFHLSEGLIASQSAGPSISVLAFPETGLSLSASFSRFTFTAVSRREPSYDPVPIFQFPHNCSTSLDHVHLGFAGRRAIWVQRDWEKDEVVMKKWSFAEERNGRKPRISSETLVQDLCEFPFRPRDFCFVAFDEATCRICVGLLTGELYVLDFV